MVNLHDQKNATLSQIKSWHFALAFRIKNLYPHAQVRKYSELYRLAKINVGCRSLVFVDRYRTLVLKETAVEYFYGVELLNSLLTQERPIQRSVRHTMKNITEYLHEGVCNLEWVDIMTPLKGVAASYDKNTFQLISEFWRDEKQDVLPILADSLDEFDGANFEAEHFRRGFHSFACPVVQHILKTVGIV